jgi:hypothetical protein
MRRLAVVGVAAALVLSGGAVALAQQTWPSVTVTPTVSPNKAGTKAHPQGVKLTTTFHWQTLGSASQPIVTTFFLLFPKGSQYNGGHYPTCSVRTLDLSGPSGCKRGSIMGYGSGTAYADTTLTHPQITVVNGGANTIYFYTVLNNPARVQDPVVGHITRMSGQWAYSLKVTVPPILRIVAGVPIELTSLRTVVGGPGHGTWLATTGCPGGRWHFSVTTGYVNPNTSATGSSSFSDSIACHR